MRIRRLMAASMAGVMAIGSSIVCQITASAATSVDLATGSIGSTTLEEDQWNPGNISKPSLTLDNKWGNAASLEGYSKIVVSYTCEAASDIANLYLVAQNGTVNWLQQAASAQESGTIELDVSGSQDKTYEAIVFLVEPASTYATGDEFDPKITITSATLVSASGETDTRTDLALPAYDGSPITMTKQKAQDWCPNGTAQGMLPASLDGVTIGTTTYGEMKEKFKSLTYDGIAYVKDSLGGSASDYSYCIYAQWGSGYTWTASSGTSLDSNLRWSLDSISGVADTDVLQVIGIQVNMSDFSNLPDAVSKLKTDETFTINPASTGVESIKITAEDGSAVKSAYTYGDTLTLKAAVTPADAAGADEIAWSSSNEDVATVSDGVVTFKKAGEVTIIAEAGGKGDSVAITVNKKSVSVTNTALDEIKVHDKTLDELLADAEADYTPVFSDSLSLTKGTDYTVKFAADAAKTSYSAEITLAGDAADRYEISGSDIKGEIKYYATGVTLEKNTFSLVAGKTAKITPVVAPDDVTLQDYTVKYTSSNTDVATVDNGGTITAVAAGKAEITVVVDDGIDTHSATASVTVADQEIPATGIELSESEKTVSVGEKFKLTAAITPEDSTDDVIWTSSDPTVAAVDENGNVTAKAVGTAEITATAGEVSAVCKLTVKAVEVSEVTLDKTEISLTEGETAQLTASVKPDNAADKSVTWTSSDPTVAAVSDGKITALSAGKATITATAGGKSATCVVTVTASAVEVTEVTLDKTEISLTEGETAQLTASVKPDDAADKSVTWTSSDPTVAAVSDGKITALSAGKATITATAGGKSATCVVTVTAKAATPDDKKYPSTPTSFTKVDSVATTVNSDGTRNMLALFFISDEDVKNCDFLTVIISREDGKIYSETLQLDSYYDEVTYTKDGEEYSAKNGSHYIAMKLLNVDDSWGAISIKVVPTVGKG